MRFRFFLPSFLPFFLLIFLHRLFSATRTIDHTFYLSHSLTSLEKLQISLLKAIFFSIFIVSFFPSREIVFEKMSILPVTLSQIFELSILQFLQPTTKVLIFPSGENSLKIFNEDKTFHSVIINFARRWDCSVSFFFFFF